MAVFTRMSVSQWRKMDEAKSNPHETKGFKKNLKLLFHKIGSLLWFLRNYSQC
jgi:hypothetical protein